MVPDTALEKRVRAAAKMLRGTKRMRVTSKAGTELDVDMAGASTVGVWGWTDRPGTLAHWPGGIVVSFPKSGTVNGTLVMAAGDINLTFKRYLTSPIRMTLKDDYVTELEGEGADAAMMRAYLAAWGDREAYAVSHVGLGHESRRALRSADDVRPARHQRHRDCAPWPAISCSPPAPTNSPAATRPAISTCR